MFNGMYNLNPAYLPQSQYQYPYSIGTPAYQRPASGSQITWVMGIENAKTYPIAPNTTIWLMDSEAQKFYVKTADQNGICSIETYKFEKETSAAPTPQPTTAAPDMSKYVTREELNGLLAQFAAMQPKTDEPKSVPPKQSLI